MLLDFNGPIDSGPTPFTYVDGANLFMFQHDPAPKLDT